MYDKQRLQELAGITPATPLNEDWRNNLIAVITTAATLLSSPKANSQAVDDWGSSKITALDKGSGGIRTNQQNKSVLNLDFGTNFLSGRYTFSKDNLGDLTKKFEQISQFIKNNQGSTFDVSIAASESRVPNYDQEPESKTFKNKLDTGQLALRRAQMVQIALKTFSEKLNANGIKIQFNINSPKISIGGSQWRQGEDPYSQKFTDFQFVKVEIVAKGAQAAEKTASFGREGQSVFNGAHHLVGISYFRTKQSTDKSAEGGVDTRYEDILFRFVDRYGKFTGEDYIVPNDWWNKHINIGSAVSDDFIEGVKQIGKKI